MISLQEYFEKLGIQKHKFSDIDEVTKTSAIKSVVKNVVESLTQNTVIMSTAPLASVLLEFRKGIPHENMVKQMEYIYGELRARNASLSESSISSRGITNTMQLLEEFVRKKRDVFEPFVSPRVDYKNILMLSYYRNTLIYIFSKEMFIGK